MRRLALAALAALVFSSVAFALSFGGASNLPAAVRPFQIVASSLRSNGVQDLVTCNYTTGNMSVFLGVGDGTFAAHTDYAISGAPTAAGVAVGDLNGDGVPDVVVVAGNLKVWLGVGDGTFGSMTSYTVAGGGHTLIGVRLGDTRGTGHLDAVILDNESSLFTSKIVVMNGAGDGTFSGSESSSCNDVSNAGHNFNYGLVLADLNGDGKLDIVFSNYNTSVGPLYAISGAYGNGDGTFGVITHANWNTNIGVTGSTLPIGLALGDLNGDGKPDLAVAMEGGTLTNGVWTFLGNGDGTFATSPTSTVATAGAAAQDFVLLADLDGSGHLSAVVNCDSGGGGVTFSILAGDGTGALGSPTTFTGTSNGCGVAVADFDGDGKLDIAVTGFVGSNNIMVWLQTTAGFRGETPSSSYARQFSGERRTAARVSK